MVQYIASGIYSGKVCVTNMDAAGYLFSTFIVKTASRFYSGKMLTTNMDAAECLFSTFVVKTASIIYLGCMRSHSDENHGDR